MLSFLLWMVKTIDDFYHSTAVVDGYNRDTVTGLIYDFYVSLGWVTTFETFTTFTTFRGWNPRAKKRTLIKRGQFLG